MKKIKLFLPLLLVAAFIVAASSMYVIYEGQHGILLRLGKMVVDSETDKPAVQGPGLHFKLPFIMNARVFDTRLQTLDKKSSRIVTAEKKDVLVDYYIKWRIENLPLYFTRIGADE